MNAPIGMPIGNVLSREARKEIGLGYPPETFGGNCSAALAQQCGPQGRIEIVESASWRTDLPVSDDAIKSTYNDRLNIWLTPDNQPPAGVTSSSNTLATTGLFACDMVVRGFRVRLLVEPEGRTIMGNFVDIADNLPGSPDVWTMNDLNAALGLLGERVGEIGGPPTQHMIPAEFLWGIPTWKAAYAAWQGYDLAILKSYQDFLLREPLTQVGTIQPFAEAEAAGLAFASNQDRVLVLNDKLVALAQTQQFIPEYFKRLGCFTNDSGQPGVGDFTVSREADASSAIFGGIGVPNPPGGREPHLFNRPMYWPAGNSINIQLLVNKASYQADMQRWLSVTGGKGGNTGEDLNLPLSHVTGMSGVMPSAPFGGVRPNMIEQSLDVAPAVVTNVPQQVQTNRAILKGGTMLWEIGVIGWRCSDPRWAPYLAQAIASGAIISPQGYGNLNSYLTPEKLALWERQASGG